VNRKDRVRKVGSELRELLGTARESVTIESPYLVPTRALRKGLRQALVRGVHVRILTNGLRATDNLWPQAGYAGHKTDLVRSGVELWEYQGPECLHTKAAVIDGETVIVGSYNLDPRSERLNSELALVVRGRPLAGEMRRLMDGHLERSARIDARGFPAGAGEAYPGIPRAKVWKLRLLRLLAPLIRGQL
jgi:putative cardiolipin synthase